MPSRSTTDCPVCAGKAACKCKSLQAVYPDIAGTVPRTKASAATILPAHITWLGDSTLSLTAGSRFLICAQIRDYYAIEKGMGLQARVLVAPAHYLEAAKAVSISKIAARRLQQVRCPCHYLTANVSINIFH